MKRVWKSDKVSSESKDHTAPFVRACYYIGPNWAFEIASCKGCGNLVYRPLTPEEVEKVKRKALAGGHRENAQKP